MSTTLIVLIVVGVVVGGIAGAWRELRKPDPNPHGLLGNQPDDPQEAAPAKPQA